MPRNILTHRSSNVDCAIDSPVREGETIDHTQVGSTTAPKRSTRTRSSDREGPDNLPDTSINQYAKQSNEISSSNVESNIQTIHKNPTRSNAGEQHTPTNSTDNHLSSTTTDSSINTTAPENLQNTNANSKNKHFMRRRTSAAVLDESRHSDICNNNQTDVRGRNTRNVSDRRDEDYRDLHRRIRADLEILTRPSWCNAQFAYDQVCQGKAKGSKFALKLRATCHNLLFRWGCFVQRKPEIVLVFGILILCAGCLGIKWSRTEVNIEKLWVESGSQLQGELAYTRSVMPAEALGTFQVLIQTGDNVATNTSMLLHLQAAIEASKVTVVLYDQTWSLSDLCYKEVPDIGEDNTFMTLAEKMFPCIIIGPLDCFWEGSKILGPDTPLVLSLDQTTPMTFTWENLDPQELLDSFDAIVNKVPEMSALAKLIEQAEITHGYLDKWCLNPHDPDCPDLAPNKKSKEYPDVSAILTNGCNGYASRLMRWPNDLIIGGIEADSQGNISSARALQTTIQLWGSQALYDKHKSSEKTRLLNSWDISKAQNILSTWQRKFVETIYKIDPKSFEFSSNVTSNELHAFTPATTEDLVTQFSNFSFARVIVGYLLMMLYACITMMRWKAYRSQGAVAMLGVVLVAASVTSGLGVSSFMGIKFNAATTQVLPFLLLGLGVDDMFLITYQFGEIAHLSYIPFEERTGECLKRVGVSVLLTSLAILSGFLFSLFVPMPALQSFSIQATVITVFNLFCVICIFPSVLSLDLIRRRKNRLDILCCFKSSNANEVMTLNPDELYATQPQQHTHQCRHPEPVNHVNMCPMEASVGDATVTVHHTIQAYSNQSYQTYLGPAAETSFIPPANPEEQLYDLPSYPASHKNIPLTPPPGYSPTDYQEIPKAGTTTPRQAFQPQQRSNRADGNISADLPETPIPSPPRTQQNLQIRNNPTARLERPSRSTSNHVTPMESVRSSTHSLVPVNPGSGFGAWMRKIFCCGANNVTHPAIPSRTRYDHVKCFTLPTLSEFVEKYYAPALLKTPVRIAVIVCFIGIAAVSVFGCFKVKDGLDLIDILPRDSREHSAVQAQMDYFSFYNMYIVTKEFDYASNQRELYNLHEDITNIKYIVKNSDATKTQFWLHYFRDWLLTLQEAFDKDWADKKVNESTWTPSTSTDGILAFKLLVQTGDFDVPTDINRVGCMDPTNCQRADIVRLVSDDGYIREDGFYNYITAWYQYDPLAYTMSQANFNPLPERWQFDRDGNLIIPRAKLFNYTQMPYYLNELKTTEDFVSAIRSIREVCDRHASQSELRVYPSGYPFLFWQQYITLRLWLFVSLGSVISAIFVVISILLYNPWAASIITLFLVMITGELLGFMGLLGVKLSAIPVVILIASVGLGVEFTVHMMLAFITSCGSRMERAKIALGHVSSPVLDGSISTLLGIVMLSGSEFDFITKYFFHVLSALVLIGFLNGLVLLPVVLSFIGPPPEVTPVGGGTRLKSPTPPPTPTITNEQICSCGEPISYRRPTCRQHPQNDEGVSYMQRRMQCDMRLNPIHPRVSRPCQVCSSSGSSTPSSGGRIERTQRELQFRPVNRMGFYPTPNTSGYQTPISRDDGRVLFYPAADFVVYNVPGMQNAQNTVSDIPQTHTLRTSNERDDRSGERHIYHDPYQDNRPHPVTTLRSAFTVQVRSNNAQYYQPTQVPGYIGPPPPPTNAWMQGPLNIHQQPMPRDFRPPPGHASHPFSVQHENNVGSNPWLRQEPIDQDIHNNTSSSKQ